MSRYFIPSSPTKSFLSVSHNKIKLPDSNMSFRIKLFVQVVFLVGALFVVQLHLFPTNSFDSINTGSTGFIGDDLIWIYENKGTRKFMDFTGAAYSVNRGFTFNITQESTGTNHVSISTGAGSTIVYLYMSSIHSQLEYTLLKSGRTTFQIEPVPDSQSKFYLKFNSNEGLVTPGGSDRVPFYRQSLFPNEKLAEFYLIPSSVQSSYDGKLENIITTAQRITNGDYGAKSAAYSQLLAEMKKFSHNLESEIFTVGTYIKEDLGVSDGAFQELPTQVQLIVSGEPLSLYYKRDGTEYTMKYEKGDHYQDIFPYAFTYSKNSDNWAITTGGSAAEHQLYVRSISPYTLSQKLSSDKEFVFKFKLETGLEHIHVFNERENPFATNINNPPFTFQEYSSAESSSFYVKRFTNELKVENSNMCGSGYVQCNYE